MRGRQLSAYGSNTYKYDANGIRLEKKTASGVTHKYWTEGERIHREYRSNGETLWYYYDASGIEGFSHSGVRYHYLKNLQGDIVGITNSDGNLVAQYFYDAWGNHKVCDGNGYENTSAGFIGNVNPFRYRGYYFDRETGLYYLQSRYYDPEFGRFINADDVSFLDPTTLGGLNLYTYCGNNPVMCVDPTGAIVLSSLAAAVVSGLLAGMIIGGVYGGVTAVANGQDIGHGIVIGALSGMLLGGIAGFAGYLMAPLLIGSAPVWGLTAVESFAWGTLAASVGGFTVGFCTDIAIQSVNNNGKIDCKAAALSGIQAGFFTLISAMFGSAFTGLSEGFGVSIGSGIITSTFSMLIDVIKNYINKKRSSGIKLKVSYGI